MSDALSAIERAYRRILLLVGRGKIATVNDAGSVQKVQIQPSGLEVRDNTPRLAEYGFVSVPPPGSDAVALFVGGDRSNGVIIATGNQTYRLTGLTSGETAIHDDRGQVVRLTPSGIVISSPIGVTISGPSVVIHATQSLKYDCDGNGTEYTPNTRDDYVTGATVTAHPLHPPQVP